MGWDCRRCFGLVGFLLAVLCQPASAQRDVGDPHKLLQDADRLAWLRAWTRAAPLYEEAERLFAARGDRRNVLYAQVSKLRGDLPRLSVPEVSQRLPPSTPTRPPIAPYFCGPRPRSSARRATR